MDYATLLPQLCGVSAPSGFEGAAAELAKKLLEPYMDEVYINTLGSVVGVRRCGKPSPKKLLLDAHLDEIGLIVTGHEDGFLRFAPLGGVDPRMLPNRELIIMTDPPRVGIIACLPPHVQSSGDYDNSIAIKDLFVDVGEIDTEITIPIGTPMTFRGGAEPLGDQLFWGKAMDDRACFATLLKTAELLSNKDLPVDLYIVGSVCEETNGAGAITATWEIAPDYCIAVDVTHGDTPDGKKEQMFPLGKGTVIGRGPNCTKWLTNALFDVAKENDLLVQTEVMAGSSGTNGWYMQIARDGIPTAIVMVPLRYMHTPLETLHLADLETTSALLSAFVLTLGGDHHA